MALLFSGNTVGMTMANHFSRCSFVGAASFEVGTIVGGLIVVVVVVVFVVFVVFVVIVVFVVFVVVVFVVVFVVPVDFVVIAIVMDGNVVFESM